METVLWKPVLIGAANARGTIPYIKITKKGIFTFSSLAVKQLNLETNSFVSFSLGAVGKTRFLGLKFSQDRIADSFRACGKGAKTIHNKTLAKMLIAGGVKPEEIYRISGEFDKNDKALLVIQLDPS